MKGGPIREKSLATAWAKSSELIEVTLVLLINASEQIPYEALCVLARMRRSERIIRAILILYSNTPLIINTY